MRLASNPKSVRFRIMSGGEEHSSLDSLRHNFCLSDLQQIEKQLLSWLKRQGKEGEDIAQELEKMPQKLAKCDSLEEYFKIYKMFFKNAIPSLVNSNNKMQKWPCFSGIETLRDIYTWFENNDKYKKNLKSLDVLLRKTDEEYCLLLIEKSGNLDTNWLSRLESFSSGHANYILGKYYLEDVPNFIKGYELLMSAKEKGYIKAEKYIKENKLDKKYDQWKNIDVNYMQNYIDTFVNYRDALYEGNINAIPKWKDSHVWTIEEEELGKFVVGCCILRRNYDEEESRYELAEKAFMVKTDNNERVIEKPFYFQKYFILTLIGQKLPESLGYRKYYQERLNDLSEYYYPARYLIDNNETHPILDKSFFRNKGITAKINILLLNLFEF